MASLRDAALYGEVGSKPAALYGEVAPASQLAVEAEQLRALNSNPFMQSWHASDLANQVGATTRDAFAAEADGNTVESARLQDAAHQLQARAQVANPNSKKATDFFEGTAGIGDVPAYVADNFGMATQSMWQPMAARVAGGLAGAAIGGVVAPGVGAIPGALIGGVLGGNAVGINLGMNEMAGNVLSDPVAMAQPVEQRQNTILATGVATGLLDSFVPGKVGGTLLKPFLKQAVKGAAKTAEKQTLKTLGKGVGVDMLQEAGTEGTQNVVQDVGMMNLDPAHTVDWKAALNAGVAGGIGAGGIGVAHAGVKALQGGIASDKPTDDRTRGEKTLDWIGEGSPLAAKFWSKIENGATYLGEKFNQKQNDKDLEHVLSGDTGLNTESNDPAVHAAALETDQNERAVKAARYAERVAKNKTAYSEDEHVNAMEFLGHLNNGMKPSVALGLYTERLLATDRVKKAQKKWEKAADAVGGRKGSAARPGGIVDDVTGEELGRSADNITDNFGNSKPTWHTQPGVAPTEPSEALRPATLSSQALAGSGGPDTGKRKLPKITSAERMHAAKVRGGLASGAITQTNTTQTGHAATPVTKESFNAAEKAKRELDDQMLKDTLDLVHGNMAKDKSSSLSGMYDPKTRDAVLAIGQWVKDGFKLEFTKDNKDGSSEEIKKTSIPRKLVDALGDDAAKVVKMSIDMMRKQGLIDMSTALRGAKVVNALNRINSGNKNSLSMVLESLRPLATKGLTDEGKARMAQETLSTLRLLADGKRKLKADVAVAMEYRLGSKFHALLKSFNKSARDKENSLELGDSVKDDFDVIDGTDEDGNWVEQFTDHEANYSQDYAPDSAVEYKGTFNQNFEEGKTDLRDKLAKHTKENDGGRTRAVGVWDALKEQHRDGENSDDESALRMAEDALITKFAKDHILNDRDAIGRKNVLTNINRTHKTIRIERLDDRDPLDKVKLADFKVTASRDNKFDTVADGALIVEAIDEDGVSQKIVTSAGKLLKHANRGRDTTGNEGAQELHDKVVLGLSALMRFLGEKYATVRVGYKTAADGDMHWMKGNDKLPDDLPLKTKDGKITEADVAAEKAKIELHEDHDRIVAIRKVQKYIWYALPDESDALRVMIKVSLGEIDNAEYIAKNEAILRIDDSEMSAVLARAEELEKEAKQIYETNGRDPEFAPGVAGTALERSGAGDIKFTSQTGRLHTGASVETPVPGERKELSASRDQDAPGPISRNDLDGTTNVYPAKEDPTPLAAVGNKDNKLSTKEAVTAIPTRSVPSKETETGLYENIPYSSPMVQAMNESWPDRKARQFDGRQSVLVTAALKRLHALGLGPIIDTVAGFYTFAHTDDYKAVAHSNHIGGIGLSAPMLKQVGTKALQALQAEYLNWVVAHELGHHFDHATGMSQRPELEVRLHESKPMEMVGAVAKELEDAAFSDIEAFSDLRATWKSAAKGGYASVKLFQEELFAQMVALAHNNPAYVESEMPATFALMKEVKNAYSTKPGRQAEKTGVAGTGKPDANSGGIPQTGNRGDSGGTAPTTAAPTGGSLSITESKSADYTERTGRNSRLGDVTIAFAVDHSTGGEKATVTAAKTAGKPLIAWHGEGMRAWAVTIVERLKAVGGTSINVAGNGIYTWAEKNYKQETINKAVRDLLAHVKRDYPKLTTIITGGQTGSDIAGAIAGVALGLKVDVHMPKGFKQRNAEKKTTYSTAADMERYIREEAAKLSDVPVPSAPAVVQSEKTEGAGWAQFSENGYEVSSAGDKRFSALNATLKDGRTIEEAYQLDVKGYRSQGNTHWKAGKGKPPINGKTKEQTWAEYKALWQTFVDENPKMVADLRAKAKGRVLTDKFASTDISQARALAEILAGSTSSPSEPVAAATPAPVAAATPAPVAATPAPTLTDDEKLDKWEAEYIAAHQEDVKDGPVVANLRKIIRHLKDRAESLSGTAKDIVRRNANFVWETLQNDTLNASDWHRMDMADDIRGRMAKLMDKGASENSLTLMREEANIIENGDYASLIEMAWRGVTDKALTKPVEKDWSTLSFRDLMDEKARREDIRLSAQEYAMRMLEGEREAAYDEAHPRFTADDHVLSMRRDASTFQYTQDQADALDGLVAAMDTIGDGKKWFLLNGKAGTGKTTIVENLINAANAKGREVIVMAPTNKAVIVLNTKLSGVSGISEIGTIHGLMYSGPDAKDTSKPKAKQTLTFNTPREDFISGSKYTVLIDEASMLSLKELNMLSSLPGTDVQFILIGDENQLEPVGPPALDPKIFEKNSKLEIADRFPLNEVRRQSLNSNILKYATRLATTKSAVSIENGDYGDLVVGDSGNIRRTAIETLTSDPTHTVALVSTNNDRISINTAVRNNIYGDKASTPLHSGEPIIGLYNGTWLVNSETRFAPENMTLVGEVSLDTKDGPVRGILYSFKEGESNRKLLLLPELKQPAADRDSLAGATGAAAKEITMPSKRGTIFDKDVMVATYAYALTIHKSQGSQWDNVFVIPTYSAPAWNPYRLIYTAVTRAAKKLWVGHHSKVFGERESMDTVINSTNEYINSTAKPPVSAPKSERKGSAQSTGDAYPSDATPTQRDHFKDEAFITPEMREVILEDINGEYAKVHPENEGVAGKDGWFNINHADIQSRVTKEAVHEDHPESFLSDYIQEFRVKGVDGVFYTQSMAQWARHLRDAGKTIKGHKANAQSAQNAGSTKASQADQNKIRKEIAKVLGPEFAREARLKFPDLVKGNNGEAWSGAWTEHLIEIAINALDPLGVSRHESVHQLFKWLAEHGADNVKEVLQNAATNKVVQGKLRRLLKGDTAAIAQLSDPEEAAAYLYQFWMARDPKTGERMIEIGPKAEGVFKQLWQMFRTFLNLISAEVKDMQHAEEIMRAFSVGQLAEGKEITKLEKDLISERTGGNTLAQAFNKQKQLQKYAFAAMSVLDDTKIPALMNLRKMIHTATGEAMENGQSYMDGKKENLNDRLGRLNKIITSVAEEDREDLQLAKKELSAETELADIGDPVVRELVKNIRLYLKDMYAYMQERGVQRLNDETNEWEDVPEYKENYFPWMMNMDMLVSPEGGKAFVEKLLKVHMKELSTIAAQANVEQGMEGEAGELFASATIKDREITEQDVAEAILARYISAAGVPEIHESSSDLGITPYAASVNRRTLTWLDRAQFEEFTNPDLVQTMVAYTTQMVKRAEYTVRFGNGGTVIKDAMIEAYTHMLLEGDKKQIAAAEALYKQNMKEWKERKKAAAGSSTTQRTEFKEKAPTRRQAAESLLSPDSKDERIAEASRELQPVMNAIMAAEGTLGRDIDPSTRSLISGLMVYQTYRLMPLSLFAQFGDPIGMIVNGATVKEAWSALVRGIRGVKNVYFTDEHLQKDVDEDIAEYTGSVDAHEYLDTMGQMYGSMYLHGKFSKLNNAMFKWNGQESFNRNLRIEAGKIARRFIMDHLTSPTEHSERRLKDYGLTKGKSAYLAKGDIYSKNADGTNGRLLAKKGDLDLDNPAVRAAIMRWTNDAILSPNAMIRPTAASDQHMALFYHLKSFAYAFHKTTLQRAYVEAQNGNYNPALALFVGYAPVMIAADAIKEMLVPGDEPAWMKGGLGDWMAHGFKRANLMGIPQFAYDANPINAPWNWSDKGVLGGNPAGLLGPTIDQAVGNFMIPISDRHSVAGELVNALPGATVWNRMTRNLTKE